MFKKDAIIGVVGCVTLFLCLASCKGKPHNTQQDNETVEDTISQKEDSLAAERLPDLSKEIPIIQKNVDKNFEQNKVVIEKKFGTQWDFCRCVIANDSLDKLVKDGAELDDAFMVRFEEVDQHCKAFLVMNPNKTPEERDLHERKIKECLRQIPH